jgi:hypothetical protein
MEQCHVSSLPTVASSRLDPLSPSRNDTNHDNNMRQSEFPEMIQHARVLASSRSSEVRQRY